MYKENFTPSLLISCAISEFNTEFTFMCGWSLRLCLSLYIYRSPTSKPQISLVVLKACFSLIGLNYLACSVNVCPSATDVDPPTSDMPVDFSIVLIIHDG